MVALSISLINSHRGRPRRRNAPMAHVVAVSVRDRAGYGISWGTDGSRMTGRPITRKEGCTCQTSCLLAGVLHVLKDAEKRHEKQVLIYISATHVVELLTDPTNRKSLICSKNLFKEIAESKVKAVYRIRRGFDHKGLQKAIYQARLVTGTHSMSSNPINDNLFKNGVIGVAIYGEYRNDDLRMVDGELKGAYARFFEQGFVPNFSNKNMNTCEWVHGAADDIYTDLIGLSDTLELLLQEQYRQVRIKTSSAHILRWITLFEKYPDGDYSTCRLLHVLHTLYKQFSYVKVEFDPKDESVLEAKKMVTNLFELILSGFYWENGVPVVYTAGSVHGRGKKAVAGGGVFWGPGDPRNRMLPTYNQSSTSGEFEAVLLAMNTALEYNISRLIIRVDSQSIIDIANCYNGDGEPTDEMTNNLEEYGRIVKKMKIVWFQKANCGEGHTGAVELAKEVARESRFRREKGSFSNCCYHFLSMFTLCYC